jgi:hypothetical protein
MTDWSIAPGEAIVGMRDPMTNDIIIGSKDVLSDEHQKIIDDFKSGALDDDNQQKMLDFIQNDLLAFSYEGMDYRAIQKAVLAAAKNLEKLKKDHVSFCCILSERGSNIDQIVKKMNDIGKQKLTNLKAEYALKAKVGSGGSKTITIPRILAVFPERTFLVWQYLEDRIANAFSSYQKEFVDELPNIVTCPTLGLIADDTTNLGRAHLMYSMIHDFIINPKKNTSKKSVILNFFVASLNSNIPVNDDVVDHFRAKWMDAHELKSVKALSTVWINLPEEVARQSLPGIKNQIIALFRNSKRNERKESSESDDDDDNNGGGFGGQKRKKPTHRTPDPSVTKKNANNPPQPPVTAQQEALLRAAQESQQLQRQQKKRNDFDADYQRALAEINNYNGLIVTANNSKEVAQSQEYAEQRAIYFQSLPDDIQDRIFPNYNPAIHELGPEPLTDEMMEEDLTLQGSTARTTSANSSFTGSTDNYFLEHVHDDYYGVRIENPPDWIPEVIGSILWEYRARGCISKDEILYKNVKDAKISVSTFIKNNKSIAKKIKEIGSYSEDVDNGKFVFPVVPKNSMENVMYCVYFGAAVLNMCSVNKAYWEHFKTVVGGPNPIMVDLLKLDFNLLINPRRFV